ncbi:MAG TPA: UDP-N-acetylglucosamine 2-epimerase (non-hydrolyzing) [Vicinamibacteria bacterium]
MSASSSAVRESAAPVVDLVAGARPNFMKLAPVVRALSDMGTVGFRIVHTGQHYDASMNDIFFEELGIPKPEVHLEVGSGRHGAQTARILERYESHLLEARPRATVVFGDVNSTMACGLAAVKLGVPVVHVEAGLRSFDPTMPEEVNRKVTDAIADLLLATESTAVLNLVREGVPEDRIRLVGNVMIDTLLWHLPAARGRNTASRLGLVGAYGLVTLHRPQNVDDPATLAGLLDLLAELAGRIPLVFPVHPRTLDVAKRANLADRLTRDARRLLCVEPLSYLDTLSLLAGASIALTDSGGLQEETSVLRVPCLTLRNTTERPCTVELGTSRLVGNDPEKIRAAFAEVLGGAWPKGADIPLWDGKAGPRVAAAIASWLGCPTTVEAPALG